MAESLHSVIWPLLSKGGHVSLVALEMAVSEAVCCFNSRDIQAYTGFCSSVDVKPGVHALWRAAEKQVGWKSSPGERTEGKEVPGRKGCKRLQSWGTLVCQIRGKTSNAIFSEQIFCLPALLTELVA